ncbi:MAG: hypothetical protein JO223_15340 [Hyphomicrobiales bacterium]|nr:hypothetical protein [Hyphomicrobiales bacterium]MBV8441658.1 hypothetical protein [Hyphomicrobiales bacterium]
MNNTKDDIHLRDIEDIRKSLQRLALYIIAATFILLLSPLINIALVMIIHYPIAHDSPITTIDLEITAALTAISLLVFVVEVFMLYLFHRRSKSAQIFSAVYADERGWYSEYSQQTARKTSIKSDTGEEHDTVKARLNLREIAENSHLPFFNSENGITAYSLVALILVFIQCGLLFSMLSAQMLRH